MKKGLILTSVGFLCLLASFANGQQVRGEIIIKFEEEQQAVAPVVLATVDSQRVDQSKSDSGLHRIKLRNAKSAATEIAKLRRHPSVRYALPNFVVRAFEVPNDPSYSSQWHLDKVQAPAAWDLSQGSSSVVIAIVDTGIKLNHPDLSAKIVSGYDFVNADTSADDDQGHGTHCAGIAAAITNNGTGVAGLGWNCSLMPVKVLSSTGSGSLFDVSEGIRWAVDHGAKVVSLALGGTSGAQYLQDAVDYAWAQGAIVIAAAGNSNTTSASYPAYYTNSIAVAATTTTDTRASFSNYGPWVDVAAPGVNIYSTYFNGGYATMSGTSMATPVVAGLAGLLWSSYGTTTAPSIIRDRIESTTDAIDSTISVHGRINAYAALNQGSSQPIIETVSPSSYTVLQGSRRSGSLTSLLTSDNARLDLRSTTTGATRYSDWYSTFNTNIANIPDSLEINWEGQVSPSGTVYIDLFDWTTSSWSEVAVLTVGTNDSSNTINVVSNVTNYMSSSGVIQVRVFRSRNRSQTFNVRTDCVKVTKVMQP